MGRAERAIGTDKARSGERPKKIGLVRTKRKKRKRDLEELHRNVLEAKRNARRGAAQSDVKRKPNFAKVLANFADKRLENEEADGDSRDGKSNRKKPKRVCERLLPLPMVGIYENGAKGREIRRAVGHLNDTSAARLRGDVLKLLKGDETGAKSSWERDETVAKKGLKGRVGKPDRPSDDDSDNSEAPWHEIAKCALVKDRPLSQKTKCIKRTNPDETRIAEVREEAREPSRQRDEDKCRRRLFEPNEKEAIAKNSFEFIDRAVITDHEIRFSPSKATRNVDDGGGAKREKREKHRRESAAVASTPDSTFVASQSADNFWGWSPASCYERLCAIVSIDNFENNPHPRYGLPDPVGKIQKILRGIFARNGLRDRKSSKKSSAKSEESGETNIYWESPGGTTYEKDEEEENAEGTIQDDSEMEGRSTPGSSVTGSSWRRENVGLAGSNRDSSVFEAKNQETMESRRSWRNVEESAKENERTQDFSSSDAMAGRDDAFSQFFERFKCRNSLTDGERLTFEMEIDNNRRVNENAGENLNVCLETPPQGKTSADNPKCGSRRNNPKHVPTILRRSYDHSGNAERTTQAKDSCSRKSCGVSGSLADNDDSSLFSLGTFPLPPRDVRSRGERTVPPCPGTTLPRSKYARYGDETRDNDDEEMANNRRRPEPSRSPGTKWNSLRMEHECSSRLSSPKLLKVTESRRDVCDLEAGRTYASGDCPRRNFFIPRVPGGVDFRAELAKTGQGRNGSFLNERFFLNVDDDGLRVIDGRSKTSIEGRSDYRCSGARGRTTLDELPREAQRDDPRGGEKKLSSFEFTHPAVWSRGRRIAEPNVDAGRNLAAGDPEAPQPPPLYGKNEIETLMRMAKIGTMNKPDVRGFAAKMPATGAFRYTETEYRMSVNPKEAQWRLDTSGDPRRTMESPFPVERTDVAIAKHHCGIIGKPVVLFRPIEPGRRRTALQSRVEEPRDRGNPQLDTGDNFAPSFSRNPEGHPEYRRMPQRFSSSEIEGIQTIQRSLASCGHPAKFLAYEQAEGENPRRIPIYDNFDVANVPRGGGNDEATFFTIVDEKPDVGVLYAKGNVAGPLGGQTLDDQLVGHPPTDTTMRRSVSRDDDSTMRSTADVPTREQRHSRRVALMIPRPPSVVHPGRSNLTCGNSAPGVESIGNATARFVHGAADSQRPQQAGQSRCARMLGNFDNGDARIIDDMADRIRLPDGRIGILLAGPMDQSGSSVDAGRVCKLACDDRAIYNPTDHRWNAGYSSNEAYRRLTRANQLPDDFSGV